MRSIIVGEVRTGRRITQIPVESASWSMVHRGPGDIQFTVPLLAEDFARYERELVGLYPSEHLFMPFYPAEEAPVWRPGDGLRPELLAAMEPVRCFAAVMEGDTVLEAGPIWAWNYDDETGRLQVTAKGIWSLFDHRVVMDSATVAYASWSRTFSGVSLGTIAKRLVSESMEHPFGELPINLPADDAADNTRTFYGYDLATVRQRIGELMDVQGGPDIAFVPRLTDDRLGVEWDMRAGTSAQPMLVQKGEDWTWDTRPVAGALMGLSYSRDASDMASRVYGAGAGMETSRLIVRHVPGNAGVDDLRAVGFPLMEGVVDHSDAERVATLGAHANAALRRGNRPYMEWALSVHADMSPRLGQYRPGEWARVRTDDHPLLGLALPKGYHRARIAQVSGDLGPQVQVALMPQIESR